MTHIRNQIKFFSMLKIESPQKTDYRCIADLVNEAQKPYLSIYPPEIARQMVFLQYER